MFTYQIPEITYTHIHSDQSAEDYKRDLLINLSNYRATMHTHSMNDTALIMLGHTQAIDEVIRFITEEL